MSEGEATPQIKEINLQRSRDWNRPIWDQGTFLHDSETQSCLGVASLLNTAEFFCLRYMVVFHGTFKNEN